VKVTTFGIGLAKSVFTMHGIDECGKTVFKRTGGRGRGLEVIAGVGPSRVSLEACSGAHHWVRELEKLGHTVRSMAPSFVAPYRESDKDDGTDAEACLRAFEAAVAHCRAGRGPAGAAREYTPERARGSASATISS